MMGFARGLHCCCPLCSCATAVEFSGKHGIIASKRCDHVVIMDNTVDTSGGSGIMLHRSCDDSIISGERQSARKTEACLPQAHTPFPGVKAQTPATFFFLISGGNPPISCFAVPGRETLLKNTNKHPFVLGSLRFLFLLLLTGVPSYALSHGTIVCLPRVVRLSAARERGDR